VKLPKGAIDSFTVYDEAAANEIAKALIHVVELCKDRYKDAPAQVTSDLNRSPVEIRATRIKNSMTGSFSVTPQGVSGTETGGKGKSNFSLGCETPITLNGYENGYHWRWGTITADVPSGFEVIAGKLRDFFQATPADVRSIVTALQQTCGKKE
jgi:hypothetical protein